MSETYLMLDIEVCGPISAYHTMIEFAVVVRHIDKQRTVCTDEFSVAMKEFSFKGGVWRWEGDTYVWWHDPARVNLLHAIEAAAIDPVEAMHRFKDWFEAHKFKNPVMVAFGPDLEWLKLYWYEVFRSVKLPFGLMAVCAKSYAMATCDLEFSQTSNARLRRLVPHLFHPDYPHTHRALDDAVEQAYAFERLREMTKNQVDEILNNRKKLDNARKLLLADEMTVKQELARALLQIEDLEAAIVTPMHLLLHNKNDIESDD